MTDTRRDPGQPAGQARGTGRKKFLLVTWLVALALAFSGFTTLGLWQLHRLQWKLALIERVESRVHAPAVEPPGPDSWPAINAAEHEYLHVRLNGHFLPGHDTLVQAVTELGGGFWLLSPFRTRDGSLILVNRGFVPPGWAGPAPPDAAEVTGLLRLSEPGGGFLRRNDPTTGRWYSRDVAAIATAQGLGKVAPYFVDAGQPPAAGGDATLAASGAADWPRPGLTVIRFSNNHLGYALTWFALALMCAGAAVFPVWDERRHRTGKT